MPSLSNAYLRVQWGGERLKELTAIHDTVCADNRKAIVPEIDGDIPIPPGESRQLLHIDRSKLSAIPPTVPQLISEICNHFRGALDYMVAQLSDLDTPNITGKKRRTQFLIEDDERRFDGQRSSYFEGINDDHFAALKRLQPCCGCDWTGLLRDLSNRDKHNDLVITVADFLVHAGVSQNPATDTRPEHVQVDVHLQSVLNIVIRDGPPLIQALQVIESQVAKTLDAFNPEFQV